MSTNLRVMEATSSTTVVELGRVMVWRMEVGMGLEHLVMSKVISSEVRPSSLAVHISSRGCSTATIGLMGLITGGERVMVSDSCDDSVIYRKWR